MAYSGKLRFEKPEFGRIPNWGKFGFGYFFEKNIGPLQVQKHNRELELIVKEHILNTIRDNIPVENILKVFRVDLVYRATHQIPGISPLGIRARYSLNF